MTGTVIKFPVKRLNERRRRARAGQERRFLAAYRRMSVADRALFWEYLEAQLRVSRARTSTATEFARARAALVASVWRLPIPAEAAEKEVERLSRWRFRDTTVKRLPLRK